MLDDASISPKTLLIAIKPQYITKILEGEKLVELRKCSPQSVKGDIILLYATTPTKALLGYATIKKIELCEPEKLWKKVAKIAGVSKKEFLNYYQAMPKACGIFLQEVQVLTNPIALSKLRILIPNFNPPQTYSYINLQLLRNEINSDLFKIN